MRRALSAFARWAAPFAAALFVMRADDGARENAPCSARGSSVSVYEGSRLFEAGTAQLGLARGRAVPCTSTRASAAVDALQRAIASLGARWSPALLRVHVDPRLPPSEAPLASIEVHATSRDILIREDAIERMPPEAWTHELLHALAPPPPPASPMARRLWLTLEEGLVSYLTLALAPNPAARAALLEPATLSDAWEELALPEYDPHPLARGLARELLRTAPEPSVVADLLLDCLMTRSPPIAAEKLRDVSGAFVARCEPASAQLLSAAAGRWLPEPLSPWPPTARVAFARDSETR